MFFFKQRVTFGGPTCIYYIIWYILYGSMIVEVHHCKIFYNNGFKWFHMVSSNGTFPANDTTSFIRQTTSILWTELVLRVDSRPKPSRKAVDSPTPWGLCQYRVSQIHWVSRDGFSWCCQTLRFPMLSFSWPFSTSLQMTVSQGTCRKQMHIDDL